MHFNKPLAPSGFNWKRGLRFLSVFSSGDKGKTGGRVPRSFYLFFLVARGNLTAFDKPRIMEELARQVSYFFENGF